MCHYHQQLEKYDCFQTVSWLLPPSPQTRTIVAVDTARDSIKMPCRYFCSFDSDIVQGFLFKRKGHLSLSLSVSDLAFSVLLILKDRSSDSSIDFYEHSFCVCQSALLQFLSHSLSSVCHYLIYFITLSLSLCPSQSSLSVSLLS